MKVTLNIAEDAELRAAVREIIAGQIRSVAREEIRAAVSAEMARIYSDAKGESVLGRLTREAVTGEVHALMQPTWKGNQPAFNDIIARAVSEMLTTKRFDEAVNEGVARRIAAMARLSGNA